MAVLEKIRVKLGIFITILIAIALLSFIVDPNTLGSVINMASDKNNVGKMNGSTISYRDYYTRLDDETHLFEALGQSVNSEEAQSQLRDLVWQDFFDEKVFEPRAASAGIAVGEDEMFDLTQGKSISPVLRSQPMFLDENGNFSREALSSFVQSTHYEESGIYQKYWDYLENSAYKNQLYSKYYSLLNASSLPGAIEVKRAVEDNNIVADIDFVMIPVGYGTDSTITVSSNEIRDYYNARKKNMKQIANRDIEYVVYEVEPSASDVASIQEDFMTLYDDFAVAENPKNFVALNSDSRWHDRYFSKDELSGYPEFEDLAFGKTKGVISEVRSTDESFSACRIISRKNIPDSVHADYALFAFSEEAKADSVVKVLNKGGKFENMQEFGWLTQAALEENGLTEFMPVFDLAKGKATKIRSNAAQGIIVFKATEVTKPKAKVSLAVLTKNIVPSEETYRDFLMKATDLADRSNGKYEEFAKIVKEENLPVIPASHITEATRRIGAVENAREVVRWAFEAKKGKVSDVISVANKYYFVAAVTEVRKEGYTSINEVAPDIKMMIDMEKRRAKLAAEVKDKIAECKNIEEVATVLGNTVSHKTGVSFGSTQNAFDPKLIGAVANANAGEIKVVEGTVGVYVFTVTDRTSGSYFTENDAVVREQQNTSYRMQILPAVMAQEANVIDNRARFF